MLKQVAHSLTFRLMLMFALAAFLVLLLLGFVVLYAVNQHFISQDKMVLDAQSLHIQHTLELNNSIDTLANELSFLSTTIHNEHELMVMISDPSGTSLFSSTMQFPATMIKHPPQDTLTTWYEDGKSYRVYYQPMVIADKPLTLIIALNIAHHESFLVSFKYIMWLSIAIAVLLMSILSYIIAKRGLNPLHVLITQTAKITADNLSQRLPAVSNYSEISQLTVTFNEMLNRLDDVFKSLYGFSADLAHELRTPLNSLKTQYQVTLSRTRSADEYQQVLQDSAEELEHLIRMTTDMLFLAKSDNGLISPDSTTFSLKEEIIHLYDFYDYIAQEKQIHLSLSGDMIFTGDKTLLRRAFSNLITNAIVYGYENSTIHTQITHFNNQLEITIENQGDSIEARHLPHLFDRFYRLDSSRHNSAEGAGLGLAITAAIVRAHNGKIEVFSANNCTRFIMTFLQ